MNQEANIEILTQLISAESMLCMSVSDAKSCESVVSTMKTIPGIASCRICIPGLSEPVGSSKEARCSDCAIHEISQNGIPEDACRLKDAGDVVVIPLKTPLSNYGFSVFGITSPEIYGAYDPFVRNLVNSVATTIENRRLRNRLDQARGQLEAAHLKNQALAERETAYRVLAENLPGMVFRVFLREDNRIRFFNKMFSEITGYEIEELGKGGICSMIAPEDRQHVANTIRHAVEKNMPYQAEYRFRYEDGNIGYFSEQGTPICGDDGRPLYIDGVIFDITGRKWAENELRNSVDTILAFFNAITESLILVEKNGTVLTLNATAAQRLGRRTDRIIGRSLHEFLSPKLSESMREYLRILIETGKPVRFEEEHEAVWFDHSLFPVFDMRGDMNSIAIYACDITARKQAEEAIRQHETELLKKTADLHDANITLKVLLYQRERDKAEMEDIISQNIRETVLPYIAQLKEGRIDHGKMMLIGHIESRLAEIASPFLKKLSVVHSMLTPQEIQVAVLTKEGKTGKEIAEILNITLATLHFHRRNLRKKLGLTHTDANLRSYLLSLV